MMFKILTRAKVLWVLLPLALLATANSNAEPMTFSYTFVGQLKQPFSAGAVLTGTIDGTIDPMNPDIVYVNSFGPVRFIRPGLPIFNYASIDSTEFNTIPSGQMTVMSFSGSILDFRSCPLGFTSSFVPPFTTPPFDDCPFAFAPGGGFGISYNFLAGAGGFASAADGTGNTPLCSDVEPDGPRGIAGCRATDVPIHAENWSLWRFDIDIKPGSDRDCRGAIPVAILGNDTLDVTQIDPATLSFEGLDVREKGNGALSCHAEDINGDDFADLVCQYQDATTEGTVTGELLDGTPIEGADIFCVVH